MGTRVDRASWGCGGGRHAMAGSRRALGIVQTIPMGCVQATWAITYFCRRRQLLTCRCRQWLTRAQTLLKILLAWRQGHGQGVLIMIACSSEEYVKYHAEHRAES